MTTRNRARLRYGFAGLVLSGSVALALTTATSRGVRNQPVVNGPLLAGVPAPVRAILQRACQNCHSESTVWPWYAQIPPISWRIHSDVAKGRAVLDLSKWNDYTVDERQGLRTTIGAAIRSSLMPPPEYLWIHRDARLSKAELEAVQAWALGEVENKRSTVSGAQPERSRKPRTNSLRSEAGAKALAAR